MTKIYTDLLILITLLALSAFFSCSETAFFTLTRAELNSLKKSNRKYAKSIISVLQRPRNTLITILLGNELVNVAFAIAVAATVYDILGEINWKTSTIISISIAVPLVLVFGEVIPKNIAVRYAKGLVPLLIVPIRVFSLLVFPVRFLLTKFADAFVILFGGDPSLIRSLIMEEEFRQMVDLGYREGVIEEGETELIHRLFELGNKTVKEIMTPEGEIFRLPIDIPLEEMIREIKPTQYRRVPIFRNEHENIIGVLHSRDAFRLYRSRQRGHTQEITEIMRPIHFVGEDVTIEVLLKDFQRLKLHMAVVINTHRKIVGLVTMDDIFRLLFTQKLEWQLARSEDEKTVA